MASMKVSWVLALVVAAALLGSGTEGQQIECANELAPAFSCLDFVQGTVKTPSSDCCNGLTQLVKSSPVCLCKLAEGKLNLSSAGITVDLKRALQLPTACNVKGADRQRCAALLGTSAPSPGGIAPGPGPAMQPGGETSTGSKSPGDEKSGSFQLVGSWVSLVAGAVAAVAVW